MCQGTPAAVAPIASTASPPTKPQAVEMNASIIAQPSVRFLVLATDPENAGHSAGMVVWAISPDEARREARAKLAADRRDHWDLRIAQKCEGMSICTGEAEIETGDFGKVCRGCARQIGNTAGT